MLETFREKLRTLSKGIVLDAVSLHVVNHGSPLPDGWPIGASFKGLVHYGMKVSDFRVEKVDDARRRAFVEVELEGEIRPVSLIVVYRLEKRAVGITLFVEEVASERPWLAKLVTEGAKDFLPHGYLLPAHYLTHGMAEFLGFLDLL